MLRGLLGADYIGFHIGDYVRHFRSSCLRVLGLESDPEAVELEGRVVGVGADPIGIDVAGFRAQLAEPETAVVSAEIEERYRGQQLVLGVERLDYSKGVPQKIRAFERMLERDPGLRRHDDDAAGARPLAARERSSTARSATRSRGS